MRLVSSKALAICVPLLAVQGQGFAGPGKQQEPHRVEHVEARSAEAIRGTADAGQPGPPSRPPSLVSEKGAPQGPSTTRAAYAALVRREAEQQGVPPDLADAVAYLESSYNPTAVGAAGEVGLMQIRPQTAALLGYKGDPVGLFDPEMNARYSVAYLAGAWRRANGDLCRALMKYRAGHHGERMSPLSEVYCHRAKIYLGAMGSPLIAGAGPLLVAAAAVPTKEAKPDAVLQVATAEMREPIRLAEVTVPAPLVPTQIVVVPDPAPSTTQERTPLVQAQEQAELRKLRGAEYWAAHERRVAAILAGREGARTFDEATRGQRRANWGR